MRQEFINQKCSAELIDRRKEKNESLFVVCELEKENNYFSFPSFSKREQSGTLAIPVAEFISLPQMWKRQVKFGGRATSGRDVVETFFTRYGRLFPLGDRHSEAKLQCFELEPVLALAKRTRLLVEILTMMSKEDQHRSHLTLLVKCLHLLFFDPIEILTFSNRSDLDWYLHERNHDANTTDDRVAWKKEINPYKIFTDIKWQRFEYDTYCMETYYRDSRTALTSSEMLWDSYTTARRYYDYLLRDDEYIQMYKDSLGPFYDIVAEIFEGISAFYVDENNEVHFDNVPSEADLTENKQKKDLVVSFANRILENEMALLTKELTHTYHSKNNKLIIEFDGAYSAICYALAVFDSHEYGYYRCLNEACPMYMLKPHSLDLEHKEILWSRAAENNPEIVAADTNTLPKKKKLVGAYCQRLCRITKEDHHYNHNNRK